MAPMLEIDHLAVAAATLPEGVAHVQKALGVRMAAGGIHPHMGTHNRLIGLEDGLYLEVIAINPDAPRPDHARWFDLDRFQGKPRLSNWIARTEDLTAALGQSPKAAGVPVSLGRGDLRWQMAVPDDGILPFDGLFPALIAWQGDAHPAARLSGSGLRLLRLELRHPHPRALRDSLAPLIDDERIVISHGVSGMRAEFDTPSGRRILE